MLYVQFFYYSSHFIRKKEVVVKPIVKIAIKNKKAENKKLSIVVKNIIKKKEKLVYKKKKIDKSVIEKFNNQIKERNNELETLDDEIFEGLVNEDNFDYRSEYYLKLDYEIANEQMNEDNDPVENIITQFETSIDYSLGVDFPEEKRVLMRDAQCEMLYKKELLDDTNDGMNQNKYTKNIVAYHNEYMFELSEILSDEEFFALFQIKEDEIEGVLLKVINDPDQKMPENNSSD